MFILFLLCISTSLLGMNDPISKMNSPIKVFVQKENGLIEDISHMPVAIELVKSYERIELDLYVEWYNLHSKDQSACKKRVVEKTKTEKSEKKFVSAFKKGFLTSRLRKNQNLA